MERSLLECVTKMRKHLVNKVQNEDPPGSQPGADAEATVTHVAELDYAFTAQQM